jgi:hypothetical protein
VQIAGRKGAHSFEKDAADNEIVVLEIGGRIKSGTLQQEGLIRTESPTKISIDEVYPSVFVVNIRFGETNQVCRRVSAEGPAILTPKSIRNQSLTNPIKRPTVYYRPIPNE